MEWDNLKLDELQFDKIGQWPRELQYISLGIIFVVSFLLGTFLLCKSDYEQYQSLVGQEFIIKKDFEKKQAQYENNEAFNVQLQKIVKKTESLISRFPLESKIPEMIEKISEEALFAGVNTERIKPGKSVSKGFYSELPYLLNLRGSYHQLGKFVSGLSLSERVITLHDFRIEWTPVSGNQKVAISDIDNNLRMEILIKSYWQNKSEEKGS